MLRRHPLIVGALFALGAVGTFQLITPTNPVSAQQQQRGEIPGSPREALNVKDISL